MRRPASHSVLVKKICKPCYAALLAWSERESVSVINSIRQVEKPVGHVLVVFLWVLQGSPGRKLFWKQCSGGTPTSATSHLIICYVCPHAASLVIKGPTEPVLEGDTVTLECLYTDSDLNISQVHFEVYSKVSWRKMDEKGKECTWKISRCACHSSVCNVGDFVYLRRSSLLWFITVPKFGFSK